MLLNFEDLPPGTKAETVQYGDTPNKAFTFYVLPEPLNQGPELRTNANGVRYLRYMWDHYLFVWPHGTGTVSVFHGDFEDHTAEPMWKFNIDQPWRLETLVVRGKQWARNHDSRFRKP